MKTIYIILWTLVMSYCSYGQQAMTRADKMNILYVGVNNPITVLADVKMEDVTFSMPAVSITPVDKNRYIITPDEVGVFPLEIRYKGELIGRELYRVKALPLATASIGIADKSKPAKADEVTMTKAAVTAQKGIILSLNNFDFEVHMRVKEYTISILRAGVKHAERTFKDNAVFNDDAKRMLESLQPGNELLISGIKYEIANGKTTGNQLYNTENDHIRIKIE